MKWIWNPLEKRVGKYRLGNLINKLDTSLTLLHRYDYEDWNTYEINNADESLLFTKNGTLKAIQCGYACYLEDINIIGLNYLEASNLLNISDDKWEDEQGSKVLIDDIQKIRLYEIDNKIRYIIIHSW